MHRLISILVSVFILFLVYLWINHITNSDAVQPEVSQKTTIVEEPKVSDPIEEEQEEDEPEIVSVPPGESIPPESKPETQPNPTESKVQNKSKTTSSHLVIAGNFLERANAEKHLKTIKSLGYTKAEILNFEISEYYTVCAGRYTDLSEARKVVKQMKDLHGIDSYVRHGN